MHHNTTEKMSKAQLLDAIDRCTSIAELFALVKQSGIDIRMHSLCSASSVPPKKLDTDFSSPEEALLRLKEAVRLAADTAQ